MTFSWFPWRPWAISAHNDSLKASVNGSRLSQYRSVLCSIDFTIIGSEELAFVIPECHLKYFVISRFHCTDISKHRRLESYSQLYQIFSACGVILSEGLVYLVFKLRNWTISCVSFVSLSKRGFQEWLSKLKRRAQICFCNSESIISFFKP